MLLLVLTRPVDVGVFHPAPKEFIEDPFGELFRHLCYVYCFSHDSLSVVVERSDLLVEGGQSFDNLHGFHAHLDYLL